MGRPIVDGVPPGTSTGGRAGMPPARLGGVMPAESAAAGESARPGARPAPPLREPPQSLIPPWLAPDLRAAPNPLAAGCDAAVRIEERIARGPRSLLAVGARVACEVKGRPVTGTYIGVDYSGRACVDTGESMHRLVNHRRLRVIDRVPDPRYVDQLAVRDASPAMREHVDGNLDREIWSGHTARTYLGALAAGGRGTWLIGGAVRDMVAAEARGQAFPQIVDFDVVVDAAPSENRRTLRKVAGSGMSGIVTQAHIEQHGTIIVGERHRGLDVTSLKARTRPGRTRHPDVEHEGKQIRNVFRGSLTQDALQRDFYCNALYYDPTTHTIIDPTGAGYAAATSRTLSFIRGVDADALQAVRYFKFRMRGFGSSAATKQVLRTVIERTWTIGALMSVVHRGLPDLCGDADALARAIPELQRVAREDGVQASVDALLIPALAARCGASIVPSAPSTV